MSNETVNILLFLAQGFEDLEAISIIDVFGWTWYRNRQAIVQNKPLYDKKHNVHNLLDTQSGKFYISPYNEMK